MQIEQLQESVVIDGHQTKISDLTEFGFAAPLGIASGSSPAKGTLLIANERIEIEFRIRGQKGNHQVCSFANFSISNREKIQRFLSNRNRLATGNEELEQRTYDELAQGIVSSTPTQSVDDSNQAANPPARKGSAKSLALLLLLFAMIGLAVLASVFLKSRSSLSVGNSALVGNYLPINANVEGEIAEIFVQEGEIVKKGDLLIRLKNPEMATFNKQNLAAIATAESKVSALEQQLKSFKVKLGIAAKKLVLDHEVAESENEAAVKSRDSVKAAAARLKPYVASGAVTELEYDAVANQLLAAEAKCTATKNQIRQVEFSQSAAKSNVLILGDRLDDEMGRIKMDLTIAKAELRELEIVAELFAQRVSELDIVAPRDGKVFVTYRQVGEYLKIADEAMALSYPGKTWAAGQVSSSQASRVRPGQPVVVSVPSLDVRLQGVVSAVGHRAMYSHGRYNAEFRGTTATDVPIKVVINDLPKDIPSGIRLDMAINTGYGIQWLDESLGYQLQPLGQPTAPSPSQTKTANASPNRQTPVASTVAVDLEKLLSRQQP